MQDFEGRVAVVTGAASGIGRALALHCAHERMAVVAADTDEAALAALATELEALGSDCLAVPTDVSDAASVESLAEWCFERFGRVNLLFNNAGVLHTGSCWEQRPSLWQRTLGVNLMGVVHGINSFVPRMLAQGEPARVVNTGSLGALLSAPGMGPYTASKMAVRGLTETLAYELDAMGADIAVSLLCPGPVDTGIMFSDPAMNGVEPTAAAELMEGDTPVLSPGECAEVVFESIRRDRFWIFTHHGFKPHLEQVCADIVAGRNPAYVPVL
jgi:NAD(P)-dependent dehydrogenase (short-subunit alcohol dehydrogenase family)